MNEIKHYPQVYLVLNLLFFISFIPIFDKLTESFSLYIASSEITTS